MLKSLAELRPDEAKALESMLFRFEDLADLPRQARTAVFDQVPIERLVIALKGTQPSSRRPSCPRSPRARAAWWKRNCRAAAPLSQRELIEARRAIVDTVLKMIAKGEIELRPPDDLSDIVA